MLRLESAAFAFILFVTPAFAQATNPVPSSPRLTESQIQSVLALLNSFGVDSGTVESVKSALMGAKTIVEKPAFCYNFNSDLTVGSAGEAVTALGKALSLAGISTGGERFDEDIAANVVMFQAKHGIRQTGYVGPITRKKLNALYRCGGQPVEPTPLPLTRCPVVALPACVGELIKNEKGCVVGIKCGTSTTTTSEVPTTTVSEQVKCTFNGAATEQKCWGDMPASTVGTRVERYSCSGIGTCTVTVKGQFGKPMGWGSSCGGSADTKIDGNNEYAYFSCKESINTGAVTFTASPTSGPAPLVVTFSVPAETAVLQSLIDFGDKTSSKSLDLGFGCANTGSGSCPPVLVSHTYDFVGTYQAMLINKPSAGPCPSGASCMAPAEQILGTVTIKVTSGSTQL